MERRLAAILVADVVGYSKLMGKDEAGTLGAIKNHRRELIDPITSDHGGRLVKTMGDGLLLEFQSAVSAVVWARAMQSGMAERNAILPDGHRIDYRIGINLGDILVDEDDIFGDGVNVAARLEGLAEPGGICISRSIRDQVRDKIEVSLEDLGELNVKNISRPVRVFRVAENSHQEPLHITPGKIKSADPSKMAFKLPEKPSIAVLPLENMTGDSDQDYLGAGLTQNIITILSMSPNLVVIGRNSTSKYKPEPEKVHEVAEHFGVRYILSGSVQRAGQLIRVTTGLIDAVDGRQIWAKRYDRAFEPANLFELEDEVAQEIMDAMQVKLTLGDQARNWREAANDFESYQLHIQGRKEFATFSLEGILEAERLWTELYERNPESALSNVLMGWVYMQKSRLGLSKNLAEDFSKARQFGEKSLSIDAVPGLQVVH